MQVTLLSQGDLADPDRDGLCNLLEYALGLNPMSLESAALPSTGIISVNNTAYLTLAFTRDPSATDITYQVEASDDLVNWTPGSIYSAIGGDKPMTAATADITPPDGSSGFTLVRDNTPFSASSRHFLRLRVIRTGG